jgi:hypothetical protein
MVPLADENLPRRISLIWTCRVGYSASFLAQSWRLADSLGLPPKRSLLRSFSDAW